MQTLDIYVGETERRRRKRRGKWVVPLIVGAAAALALTRETPLHEGDAPSKTVKRIVAPPARVAVVQTPPTMPTTLTAQAPPATTSTTAPVATTPPPVVVAPAHVAVAPSRLDFGEGPPTRGVPAQLATIRNDGGEPLARVSVGVAGPFLVTSGCPDALAPGEQCAIAVVFAPKQPGRFAGALDVAAGDQRTRVALRGSVSRPREVVTPTAPPARPPRPAIAQVTPRPAQVPVFVPPPPPARMLCFDPPFLRFVSTGKQTITLTNPEAAVLRVVAIVPIGRQGETLSGYEIEPGRCLRELKARQQCRFTIRAHELALRTRETMHVAVYYDDPLTGERRTAQSSSACGGR